MNNLIMIFQKFWLYFRVILANYFIKKEAVEIDPIISEGIERCTTTDEVKNLAAKIYKTFTWTQDSLKYLFDYMRAPDECYQDYYKGKLNDDCDGFHAALYHATQKHFESYLITCMTDPMSQSHTMLLFKNNDVWYVVDYKTLHVCGTDIKSVISTIEAFRNIPTNCYNLTYFDYKTRKWKIKGINK